jgi:hypothetical protein
MPIDVKSDVCPECGFAWVVGRGEQHSQECSRALSGEIMRRFTYHAPRDDQKPLYHQIRGAGNGVAQLIVDLVPDCRERSLALTKLEEAVMWANAGIARRG